MIGNGGCNHGNTSDHLAPGKMKLFIHVQNAGPRHGHRHKLTKCMIFLLPSTSSSDTARPRSCWSSLVSRPFRVE
ncbi:uncharacterized protein DMAD_05265 [Drosophila madeirensis]|uniref:Uncharacterized protein n=1 Tax=Drosophila madeirensis TaxID=30013 RepID=A0AAU9FM59_DROMD